MLNSALSNFDKLKVTNDLISGFSSLSSKEQALNSFTYSLNPSKLSFFDKTGKSFAIAFTAAILTNSFSSE